MDTWHNPVLLKIFLGSEFTYWWPSFQMRPSDVLCLYWIKFYGFFKIFTFELVANTGGFFFFFTSSEQLKLCQHHNHNPTAGTAVYSYVACRLHILPVIQAMSSSGSQYPGSPFGLSPNCPLLSGTQTTPTYWQYLCHSWRSPFSRFYILFISTLWVHSVSWL